MNERSFLSKYDAKHSKLKLKQADRPAAKKQLESLKGNTYELSLVRLHPIQLTQCVKNLLGSYVNIVYDNSQSKDYGHMPNGL